MRKLRAMLIAYREAGGDNAVVLIHDDEHGAPLIDALARFGDGLPAQVLPLAVNEVTQIGLEAVTAAFAYVASAMRLLLRARPRHDVIALRKTVGFAEAILGGLGFGLGRIATVETDDPDTPGSALRNIPSMPGAPRPASFSRIGAKPVKGHPFPPRGLNENARPPVRNGDAALDARRVLQQCLLVDDAGVGIGRAVRPQLLGCCGRCHDDRHHDDPRADNDPNGLETSPHGLSPNSDRDVLMISRQPTPRARAVPATSLARHGRL
jgi:hypothetical protein